MTLKEEIIKYLEEKGVYKKDYRLKYFKASPYQKRRYKPEFWEEECWLYPKEIIKNEKFIVRKGITYRLVDSNGNPVMVSDSGLLITRTDFEDKDYLFNALSQFIKN